MAKKRSKLPLLEGRTDMFKRILICLDGSDLAEQILPYAIEQALRFESTVVLLRVVPWSTTIIPGLAEMAGESGFNVGAVEQEKREGELYLKAIAKRLLEENSLHADCVSVRGSPGQAIVEYAALDKTELIAIATHGRSGPSRVIFGSVADFVLRQSSVPILLIRPCISQG